MDNKTLQDVVAAIRVAYGDRRPCELCGFIAKCGEMYELDGFCDAGVAIAVRGMAARLQRELQSGPKQMEPEPELKPEPKPEPKPAPEPKPKPKQERLPIGQDGVSEKTAHYYTLASEAIAARISRRTSDLFLLIDQLEETNNKHHARLMSEQLARWGLSGNSIYRAMLKAYILAVRPDMVINSYNAKDPATRYFVDPTVAARLSRELEQRRGMVR